MQKRTPGITSVFRQVAPGRHVRRSGVKTGFAPLACAVAGSVASTVAAVGMDVAQVLAFELGPVKLRPGFTLAEMYNDNIYYRSSQSSKQGDLITVASPSLSFSIGRQETVNPWMDFFGPESNFINVQYRYDYMDYLEENELDTGNHSVEVTSRLKGNRLSLTGRDSIAFITGILGGTTSYRQVVQRMSFSDNYTVAYQLSPKTRFYVGGQHYTTDYDEDTPLYDITNWRITGGAGHTINKTSVFGEVHFAQAMPSRNLASMKSPSSLDSLGGYLGAQGTFTQRLTGTVKAGYEAHSYSDGSSAPGSVIVDVSLNHRFRENTASSLFYSRQTVLSPEVSGVNYNIDSVGLQINQRFGAEGRIQARLRTTLEWHDYSDSKVLSDRADIWYRVNLDLVYLIRAWWRAGLSYEFETFSSSYVGLTDYDVNRVTFYTQIGY